MKIFSTRNDLLRYAERFIQERIVSLEKDVSVCLKGDVAFPAILYCFATIDLLGALLSGKASKSKKPNTSKQSREYMQKYMAYTKEQSELLQQVFRHKITHLAQPNPVVAFRDKKIAWQYYHTNSREHLQLVPRKGEKKVTQQYKIQWNHIFIISIWDLVNDIVTSVYKPAGYLHDLSLQTNLREKFEEAILDIYKNLKKV